MIKIVDGVNSYSLLREKKIFIKKFSNTRRSLHDNSHIITLPSSTNSLVSLITFHPVNQRLSSRYFIRFDRLILPGRACRYTLHISTVTSCIELWFPTSASVASPFFFFSFSLSLALFPLLRVSFSSSFFLFLFLLFLYIYRGVIMRQRWSNFVASRLLRNWSRRTLPPSIPKRNFQAFLSKATWNTRWFFASCCLCSREKEFE